MGKIANLVLEITFELVWFERKDPLQKPEAATFAIKTRGKVGKVEKIVIFSMF